MFDFLELYVADQAPWIGAPLVQATAPLVFDEAFGIQNLSLPSDPIQQEPSYASAKAAFEKLPRVRFLFDNGAGKNPGEPYPGFEHSFGEFPVPGTTARAFYLSAGGAMTAAPPAATRAAAFTWNAHARPLTDFTGDTAGGTNGLWTATPPYKWTQDPSGTAASFATAPLAEDTTVIGAGALTAWVRSSAKNVDLQATVSEIRPDGKETFVQNGWLRANERKLDAAQSTPVAPVLTLRAKDVRSMPKGRFVRLTIPLYYEAHAYRKGSRIRVRVSAPNGDQPIWAFSETQPKAKAAIAIGAGRRMPSRLVLPVVPGLSVPTPLPPCPGLRGEPCRDYQAMKNRVIKP
jgi:hypothetical protein